MTPGYSTLRHDKMLPNFSKKEKKEVEIQVRCLNSTGAQYSDLKVETRDWRPAAGGDGGGAKFVFPTLILYNSPTSRS